MKPITLLVSCEHAVNRIPQDYQPLFHTQESIQKTHWAMDFGALEIAQHISKTFNVALVTASVSRLLIDCNRSLHHKTCFSEFTRHQNPEQKKWLIDHYYTPYRNQVETLIQQHIDQGYQVFHISSHSFVPVLNGVTRNAGIGLLYDPRRHGEKEVAREWAKLLLQQTPTYRVRMNYPYSGQSDGFTTSLRKRHPEQDYLGFELEVNQALLESNSSILQVSQVITSSLGDLLQLL
jgi:predicted N-formylglutamate amidohydrolase